MAKHSRKTKRLHRRLAVAYIIVIAVFLATVFALTHPSSQLQPGSGSATFPPMPTISLAAVQTIAGNQAYFLASNSSSSAPGLNGTTTYVRTYVFLYRNYTKAVQYPASISVVTMVSASNASANQALIGALFGDRPAGAIGGYVYNSSVPIQNSTSTAEIGGANVTFYNTFESTQGSGLPLYQNTSISPPVFAYTSAFQYGNAVGEVVSMAQAQLPKAPEITLAAANALAQQVVAST